MAKKIKKSFSTFLKALILIAVCLAIAFLIVWPLWKFATSSSKIYTYTVLSIILVLIVFLIVSKVRKNAKK